MKHKERLDVLLVVRGLAESRSRAQAVIMAGEVYVNGQKADKAGMDVPLEAEVEVRGNVCPYVSRGGLKLEKALRDFGAVSYTHLASAKARTARWSATVRRWKLRWKLRTGAPERAFLWRF